MQVTIEVPDGPLTDAVNGWTDGASYTFTVTQDAPGQFTAQAAEAAEPMEEETAVEEEAPAPATAPANPAVRKLMAKKPAAAAAAA